MKQVRMGGMVALMGMMSSVFALSFVEGTVFLDATTKEACELKGGDFTEWYGQTYCTKMPEDTPAYALSVQERTKINVVAVKIADLIGEDEKKYTFVMDLLATYKEKFTREYDAKRLAIVTALTEHLADQFIVKEVIPAGCVQRYDGCNTCSVENQELVACTEMACFRQEEPMCRVYEKTIMVADHTVACVGEASMDCLLVKEVGDTTWTYFYEEIAGFDYVAGYTWTLRVRETHLDPETVPADGASVTWKLEEVLAVDKEIPVGCETWYDGCNTCQVTQQQAMICTRMACQGEPLLPYCMDPGIDTTKATDYNSSRSNKHTNS